MKIANKISLAFIVIAVITFSGICYSTNSQPFHVSHYSFGKITINDKSYTNDIAIWPDGKIVPGPEDMHFMSTSDFKELFNFTRFSQALVMRGFVQSLIVFGQYAGQKSLDLKRQ